MHSDKEMLFQNISFSIKEGQKAALIGNNGSGKSTLLQIISGDIPQSSGEVVCPSAPCFVPQHFGQYDRYSVAQVLRIDKKLEALYAILEGSVAEKHFAVLGEDWNIEERAREALAGWGLERIDFSQGMDTLSGGEKTKLFLAGIAIHAPEVILLDEPTNHLDDLGRIKLYDFIGTSPMTMLIVSHDRTLLNLISSIYELDKDGITSYGGNYEFYENQKEQIVNALSLKLEEKEKELRLARRIAREAAERKQKHEMRGEKSNAKKGIGKMAMDTFKDKAEKSRSKLKDVHSEKLASIAGSLTDLRAALPDLKPMKIDFNNSVLHTGKVLVSAQNIRFNYNTALLWQKPLSFQIKSGDRILIKGVNGTGKTTLLKLITGALQPSEGSLLRADFKYIYLDQEYTIIRNDLSVLEQVWQYSSGLQEHEIKIILNRFLFPFEVWGKLCGKLSGGEKMKLALCCLMVDVGAPDVFILDEPTNNIDIQNVEILTLTIKEYGGTLLVVSHDEYFVRQIGIDYAIVLSPSE